MKYIFDNHLTNLVTAEIVFGSPRRNCRNLGICKVLTESGAKEQSLPDCCLSATANILIGDYGRLLMLFPMEGITEEVITRYFQGDVFTIESAYTLPPEVCTALGRDGGRLSVMPGKFPVLMLGEGLLISVPLMAVSNEHFGREEVYRELLTGAIAG
ncbi:hypothetical protein FUA23_14330 [Neolewinella aurantiaca]|uniref:Uncharacterized protein n=1 Tax=Neolewinella aurantiaca TaxID=2602767 RepID=A0A5C7FPU0_9BACT|nr:hypothetical protein [Neolewinella aurantiaca]TXF88459.1 hypothetical protein FUA23_14330 [Neolewinella aurantiaca]